MQPPMVPLRGGRLPHTVCLDTACSNSINAKNEYYYQSTYPTSSAAIQFAMVSNGSCLSGERTACMKPSALHSSTQTNLLFFIYYIIVFCRHVWSLLLLLIVDTDVSTTIRSILQIILLYRFVKIPSHNNVENCYCLHG